MAWKRWHDSRFLLRNFRFFFVEGFTSNPNGETPTLKPLKKTHKSKNPNNQKTLKTVRTLYTLKTRAPGTKSRVREMKLPSHAFERLLWLAEPQVQLRQVGGVIQQV
jgi:hypothetical protein